jgi:23S rRNA (adenine2503-C2)-methyltransferase
VKRVGLPKRITISTVGVTPQNIRQMANDAPSLRLAISLHGATQDIRERLMPATKGCHASLCELESALDDHIALTGQYGGPLIEYLLIDDVNDSGQRHKPSLNFVSDVKTRG